MNSGINYGVDDKDLDDAEFWAVIDAAAAASTTVSKHRNNIYVAHKQTPIRPLPAISNPSPHSINRLPKNPRSGGEVSNCRPPKISRTTPSSNSSMVMVKQSVQHSPSHVTNYSSPELDRSYNNSPIGSECSPETTLRHCLAAPFPTVSLFKQYQNAAMAILEKSDYTMISGSPFIKKAGWRKISFYFNLSYEIKEKNIEFDENRNVLRAEFIVRAHMQGSRFSDGWGSCERREKKFQKPNHDIPSTAETRAKNKACQDLLGIGEYRPGVSQSTHR
ncbi:uncharacterized protein LOC107793625 isoform X1 [Nicotiana tabacum]|uniref:Uncharacterized protein LOC107793625 isoform X1 n=1 Tax=Nicotiana tabacum TaxID=4097 RepID=A0A1S4A4A5_TOBAC